MASEATIRFNFQKALAQADQLDTIANNLNKISSGDLNGTLQVVSANWKGQNASAYLEKGGKLQGNIGTTAKDLHSIASDIRIIAKRVYRAEMAALEIAQIRKYK